MNQSKHMFFPLRQDDEPDEDQPKDDNKGPEMGMLIKKMEQYFFSNRTVELWGAVDDRTAKEVVTKMKLLDADKPGEEIRFLINSPGGIVTSGMVIYDTMKLLKSPVSTICMGLAASMGSVLLSGGVKGRRFVFPHAEIMIHQPSLGGSMQGVSVDLEIQARQTKKVKEISARILAENCGKKMEQILKDFDRDYWMDAKEAIEYGIVDQLIDKL
jgi:ATP-dependent Clp protease protease subunit